MAVVKGHPARDLRTVFPRSLPLLLVACASAPSARPGTPVLPYDLRAPAVTITLPNTLVEISALTDVDSNTVACVQDEVATMYLIPLHGALTFPEFRFGGPGDMEGLTRVGHHYYALRSDGLIYDLEFDGGVMMHLAVRDSFRLELPNHNIEGLGYDERNDRVLVSPKDFIKGSKEGRDERVLYAFDPQDSAHRTSEVLRLSISDLLEQTRVAGIAVPEKKDKDHVVPALKLRYSSVAVHPYTDHYYLLSAVDRTLLVVDRQGKLIALEQLDASLLPKPEGITFMPNGDLVLSSEGKVSPPVIVRYSYRKG